MTNIPDSQQQAAAKFAEAYSQLSSQIGRVIVGQDEVIEQLCIAIAAQGHAILVGVPGLAKTLLVRSFAEAVDLEFTRIQFTPDLMPADITGAEVLHSDSQTKERSFKFVRGPLFSNIVLADEINRTPPKTQAALLEAMQERQVTVAGNTMPLPNPFFVLATQNPIEQEGTYPLPEAALDRFLFFIKVDYPSADQEIEILRRTTGDVNAAIEKVLNSEDLIALQELVKSIPVADSVLDYAVSLTRNSRPGDNAPDFINANVTWGAGPRASQSLVRAAKARALLNGKNHASIADIQAIAKPALRHRVALNFAAESEGLNSDSIVEQLIDFTAAHSTSFNA
ncbi:MAG: MoxR family ATPase [Planctomycetes bacterium]|nr:MoxR family ATPase [Planctomycetota bacterium]